MTNDDRNIVEVLRAELEFVEKGGYGRSVHAPWKPTSTFRDSLSCINFADPEQTHPCSECLLIDFVPPDERTGAVPCHHIRLNETGETVETLEERGDQQDLEDAVKNWLRVTIKKLENQTASSERRSEIRSVSG